MNRITKTTIANTIELSPDDIRKAVSAYLRCNIPEDVNVLHDSAGNCSIQWQTEVVDTGLPQIARVEDAA